MKKTISILLALALVLSLGLVTAAPVAAANGPPVDTGLVLHLDASDVGSITKDGANRVEQWRDLSGQDNHAGQATEANQPEWVPDILFGKPVVRFDGSTDYLNLGDPTSLRFTSSVTVFFLAKKTTDGRLLSKVGEVGERASLHDYVDSKLRFTLAPTSTTLVSVQGDTTISDDYHAIAFTYNAAEQYMSIHLDGEQDGYNDTDIPSSQFNDNGRDWNIGRNNRGILYLAGDITEILIFDRALSDTEREAVEDYLTAKWLQPPDEVWVCATDGDDGYPGTEDYPFATIQRGIDVVADGGTVYVAAGMYTEQLTITDKSLTITGESESTVIVQAASAPNDTNNVFTIDAVGEDVTIQHLTIRHGKYGIYSSFGNVNVLHCTLYHNGWDGTGVPATPTESGMGDFYYDKGLDGGAIRIEYSVGSEIAHCTVYENDRGVRYTESDEGHIHNNIVYGNIQSGIYLAKRDPGCTNTVVEYNQSYGNMNNGILVIGGKNNIVRFNQVYDNWNTGIHTTLPCDFYIQGNTVTNNCLYEFNAEGNPGDSRGGIYGGAASHATLSPEFHTLRIEDNTVTDNQQGRLDRSTGILLGTGLDAAGIVIQGNTVSGHEIGIHVKSQAATTVINYNNIAGNTLWGVLNNPDTLDATLNWWGDASGPSGVGPGTGDAVSANVDFMPWLMEEDGAETTETNTDTGADAKAETDNVSAQATGGNTDTTVTVAEYVGNPTGVNPGFLAGAVFFDVHVGGELPSELEVIFNCPGGACSGMVLKWFDGTRWRNVSPVSYTNGEIVATLSGTSSPTIAELTGTPFALGSPVVPSPGPTVYGLMISSTAGGSVTTPGEGTFPYEGGRVAKLVAEAESGYRFVEWTGDVDTIAHVDAASTIIAMDDWYIIKANFEPTGLSAAATKYTLTVANNGGGSVFAPGEETFTYDAGTMVSLVATPADGYDFVNWTGDVAGIVNPNVASTIITMNGDYSIAANFDAGSEEAAEAAPTAGVVPGCFIATAAYGTPSAEQINVLREFRDVVLLESGVGSRFVTWYYRTSPPIAEFLAGNEFVRTVTREFVVDPVVWLVEATGALWRTA